MAFEVVGKPEPFQRHGEHPVHGPLDHVPRLAAGLRQALHPHLTVPQMEVLFHPNLDESALEGPVRRVLVDVCEQRDPGTVEETVGHDQLGPVV